MSVSRRKSLAATVALRRQRARCAVRAGAGRPHNGERAHRGVERHALEGPVTTEAIPARPGLTTESSEGAHQCDVKDNGLDEGFAAAAANPTTALHTEASDE